MSVDMWNKQNNISGVDITDCGHSILWVSLDGNAACLHCWIKDVVLSGLPMAGASGSSLLLVVEDLSGKEERFAFTPENIDDYNKLVLLGERDRRIQEVVSQWNPDLGFGIKEVRNVKELINA